MSVKTERKNRGRMSQAKIDDILKDLKGEQPIISIPAESVSNDTENNKSNVKKTAMHYNYEYDSLKPELKLKEFQAYIRKCITQYESDLEALTTCEQEIQDILHYMEMSENQKRQDGFKLYKRLTDARRERRRCKNEIEILQPVYSLFHGTKLLEQLAQTQGTCRLVKESIDDRVYLARTDILDEFYGGDA